MWRVSTLSVILLCLQLSGSEDLYWRPNTDWSNPSNWALGRAPCRGDVADFSSVPRGSVIKLDGSTTVRSVVLPVGSSIVLGSSVTLRLSNSTTCEVQTPSGPMVAEVKEDNTFIGAGPKYWECPQNWEVKDGVPAKTAPCGRDRAIFEEDHYYSTVESNATSVSVQYLKVRGVVVTTGDIKTVPEFKLNLSIVPACQENPSLCPCLTNCLAPEPPNKGESRNKKSGRTAGIVVAVLVLVLLVVALTVLVIVLWLRWRRKNRPTPYMKDDLIGEPDDNIHNSARSDRDSAVFDNPIYEAGVKKPAGSGKSRQRDATTAHEMETIAILRPSEYEPVGYTAASVDVDEGGTAPPDDNDKKVPVLNEYERLS